MTTAKRRPGVKLVRGPFVRLPPHPEACTSGEALVSLARSLRAQEPGLMLAADLFSGAGGLSLGLERAGVRIVLAVDHDPEAVETHAHHFGGLALDWDLAEPTVVEKVADLICSAGIDVLAGGPPCQPFSRASRSGIRDRVRQGLRDPHDQRRDLWRSFLEVARLCRPRAVVMENVPDMALDREMFILRSMVLELEQLGYAVEERLVDTSQYGVPQFRQRLIMVALADGVRFRWPPADEHVVKVSSAISDLPPVVGGWRPPGGADGWQPYGGPRTSFQRAMRMGVPPEQSDRVYDHITRPVRADDAQAFDLMDAETLYSDLPAEYKRYRDDIFDDKYKRLDEHDLSRTITAHIAKDGYWYIHPQQNRTITVTRSGPAADLPRLVPVRRAALGCVPADRQCSPACAGARDRTGTYPGPGHPGARSSKQRDDRHYPGRLVPQRPGTGDPVAQGHHPLAGPVGGTRPRTCGAAEYAFTVATPGAVQGTVCNCGRRGGSPRNRRVDRASGQSTPVAGLGDTVDRRRQPRLDR